MKYIIMIAVSITLALGFSSCEKTENIFCYECTHPNNCTVDICNEKVVTDNSGVCVFVPNKSGSTNVEFKNAYEADGYTCRIK